MNEELTVFSVILELIGAEFSSDTFKEVIRSDSSLPC